MAENTHYRTYANPAPQARLLDFTTMSKRFASSYPNHFALVIDNCFTPDECENLIALAESDEAGWQIAQVNVGGGQQVTALDMRNSGRIIRDDFDMAGFIYTRVRPWLDELGVGVLKRGDQGGGWGEVLASVRNPLKRGEGGRWREVMASVRNPLKAARLVGERWEMTRPNERMRFLKYGPGQYFEPHCDGAYSTLLHHPSQPEERTFLTLQIYLRSSPDLQGGATRFFPMYGGYGTEHYDVEAVPGRCIIFQHRNLLHSGDVVRQGEKVALRTDILYRRVDVDGGEAT